MPEAETLVPAELLEELGKGDTNASDDAPTWTLEIKGVTRRHAAGASSIPEDELVVLSEKLRDWLDGERRLKVIAGRMGVSRMAVLQLLEKATLPGDKDLSDAESDVLRRAGVDLAGPVNDPFGVGVLASGKAHLTSFWQESPTIEEVAGTLGVGESRIRQRLAANELSSVGNGETRRVPRWQLWENRLLPELSVILEAGAELHPITLAVFMTSPNIDLVVGDQPVSPVEWLGTGGESETVSALLEGLSY